jgi:predicted transposase YbfD/YdcC
VLAQEAVAEKSNEITAIPLLLERLQLTGALVTIDAMGTQADIAEAIIARGGDYLLALKANWPATHADVAAFFADPPQDMIAEVHETVDGDHGRIETRRHLVCHDVGWLVSDRRYPGEPRFPHLAMIGMVETHVERDGKVARERRYYIASAKLDARVFALATRAHWSIENRLHWVLDVVFHDDLARLRTGYGPQNMAVVKHMAMNLVRNPKDKHSLKVRRKLANLNPEYLETILRQSTPLT